MSESTGASTVDEKLEKCEAALQYKFRDRALLERCLTHASVARTRLESNERLEFLGDAILGAVVCELLFHQFPDAAEGELTRIKSALVSRHTCGRISRRLHVEEFLLLGKGLSTPHTIPVSILAAAFESLVAGVYLDGGLESARALIERVLKEEILRARDIGQYRNYKSLLQQIAQKDCGETPVYRLLDEKGPDHSKCFQISAVIGPQVFPAAWGPTKKEAEQSAAHKALLVLQGFGVDDDEE